jgi:ubiquinone/menaquinone biosynthesis C-methylase UbiE
MGAAAVVGGVLLVLYAPVLAQLPPLEALEVKKEFAELIKLIDVQPGMSAADVGAGSGAWAGALAAVVGPGGRVYATEIGTSELAALRKALDNGGSANIIVVEGTPRETNLPLQCCDVILLRRVYHHLSHPQDMANSLVAALKPGGRLVIIDSRPPPSSRPWPALIGHYIDPDIVRGHFGRALTHVATVEPWMPSDSYALLFVKPEAQNSAPK